MSCFVYILTCIPSGKAYVGVSKDPKVRWQQHQEAARHGGSWALCRAIRKYGPESFDCQVIEHHVSESAAFEAEKRWIRSLRDNSVCLYNMTPGGEGRTGPHSAETRARISAATKRAMTSEVREKISASRKRHPGPNKGKKFSLETCAKISAARRDQTGQTHTAETRSRMSALRKLYWTRRRFLKNHNEILDYLTKKSDK